MGKVSMKGVCDMHVHTNPDLRLRAYDDFELADAAIRGGARAIVIKTHLGFTVNRAYLTNQYVKRVYGENEAGGKRDLASDPVCETPFGENGQEPGRWDRTGKRWQSGS